jgi:tetratricopeptide (TPR) repeat protein
MLRKYRALTAIYRRFTFPRGAVGTQSFLDLYSRASSEFQAGNLEISLSISKRALELYSSDTEIARRDVAAVRLNVSHILKLLNRFPESKEMADLALKELDLSFSTNKPEVCHALDVLAEVCCEIGEVDEGLQRIERGLELKTRIHGTSGLALAKSYNIRGTLLAQRGEIERARSDYLRALGINVMHLGRTRPLPVPVGITLSNIAGVLRREGGPINRCAAIYRCVLESFESNLPNSENSWMVGSCMTDLSDCLLESRNPRYRDEAKTLLARSVHIFLSTRGLDHPSTARATSLLRRCDNLKSQQHESSSPDDSPEDQAFVTTLLDECEKIVPKQADKVSGDIIFLDRRGHVGHGHPHAPLI